MGGLGLGQPMRDDGRVVAMTYALNAGHHLVLHADMCIPSAFPSKVLGIGDGRLGVQMRYSHSPVPNRRAESALVSRGHRTVQLQVPVVPDQYQTEFKWA